MKNSSDEMAVVLLSGGLDSAVTAAIAVSEGRKVHALSFNYGQRHAIELQRAGQLAQKMSLASHTVVNLDRTLFSSSALTGSVDIPRNRSDKEIETGIPDTYVPARNIVFLSLAVSYAESLGAGEVFIGVNALDYSGYPDCRPEFIDAYQRMIDIGTKVGVEGQPIKIRTPLINLTKDRIIEIGIRQGVDFGLTNSCYDPLPNGRPCGECDSCIIRAKGFSRLGRNDPLVADKS